MAVSRDFTHLPFPLIISGRPKLHGGGNKSDQTKKNEANRINHGSYIKRKSVELSRFWHDRRQKRLGQNLPPIERGIPILLEIDPSSDIDFLRGLGFEIICEIKDGFIIVATEDMDFTVLNEKTEKFIENITKRCNTPAKIYALCDDSDRLKQVLSSDLYDKWTNILPDQIYVVDIGISCCGNIELPKRPKQDEDETDEHYSIREQRWERKFIDAYMEWDEIKRERESTLEKFVYAYEGAITEISEDNSKIYELSDSFSARLKIPGTCLRDLALNYPYVFEISEAEMISMGDMSQTDGVTNDYVQIERPAESAPIVCVIDSGIQEEHKYLAPAIIGNESISLLPDNKSVSDEVSGGGHGTRVTGAILYPDKIPVNGVYKLPCRIRNMRILDENNCLPTDIYPPMEISVAVQKYNVENPYPTKVFNHSIGSHEPCEMKHMSSWAAEIDNQSYKNDVLFIQAAGNVSKDIIGAYWRKGTLYPEYLKEDFCRISNPAQSLQAITVGSVSMSDLETDDIVALGKRMEVSSFSRSGPGIWDVLKPEVVEYGGTYAYNKNSDPPLFMTPSEVCPMLIRKSPEGPAFARDTVGTSFSTPKVSYIASQIEATLPKSPALLYRALLAQSARWPKNSNLLNKEECVFMLRHMGFGIPDVDRATHNDEYRITLITPEAMEIGEDEAHIFQIPIPEELSNVGEDYDILLEITLSYAASPRRTRRNVKGYLSTWLDWCCSRMGESAKTFSKRIFKTGSVIEDDGNFNWVIGEAINRGIADNYSRKNGTLQKDWCIIKSHQLSDAFCVAVRGHRGWGGLFKAKYSLAVSFEAINQDIPIYEPIRNEIELTIENSEIEIEMSENR